MGRHPTGKIPSQPLTIIMSKHREIMRRLIAGDTQHQIALDLDMTENRLSIICNSPLFKRELKKLEDEVRGRFINTTADVMERLNLLQPAAIQVLEDIIRKKEVDGIRVSLPLKHDTALDVLELNGHGKKKNNTVADAMSDVVKIIEDGFKLAKAAIDASPRVARTNGGSSGSGSSGNGSIHIGSSVSIDCNVAVQPPALQLTVNTNKDISQQTDEPEFENSGVSIVNLEDTEYNIQDEAAS